MQLGFCSSGLGLIILSFIWSSGEWCRVMDAPWCLSSSIFWTIAPFTVIVPVWFLREFHRTFPTYISPWTWWMTICLWVAIANDLVVGWTIGRHGEWLWVCLLFRVWEHNEWHRKRWTLTRWYHYVLTNEFADLENICCDNEECYDVDA